MTHRTLLLFLLLFPVSLLAGTAILQHIRIRRLVQRVKELDPDKGKDLKGFGNRFVDMLVVYNPFRVNELLRSQDDLGNEQLKEQIIRLRKIPVGVVIVTITTLGAFLFLVLVTLLY